VRRIAEVRARNARDNLRVLAVVRLAALPVILAGERLVPHPEPAEEAFTAFWVAGLVYALVALVAEVHPRARRPPGWLYAPLDLALICALAYTSGGAFSQVRLAFVLLPLGAAFLFPPRGTAVASAVAVLGYLAVSLPHPVQQDEETLQFELVQALYLGWLGLAACLLSAVLTQRAERIEELAASRGRLVVQALDAEERERRRLADALHDEAIQNLLAARQELPTALAGDAASAETVEVGLDRAIRQLRGAVFQLHPYVLEHAGLEAALRAIAEEQGRRARFRWTLDVDEEAARGREDLLVSVARELLVNAAKHADATTVAVEVRRAGSWVELAVRDDGRGLDPERVRAAPRDGHIGLASLAERVEAVGGEFSVEGRPQAGTVVTARLPLVAAGNGAGARPPAGARR